MNLTEFPKTSYEEWRKEAESSLKGAPFDKKLVTTTAEGITTQPIYNASDIADLPHLGSLPGSAPFVRGNSEGGYKANPWFIAQEIPALSAKEFNAALRSDLQRGQTAVYLTLDRASRAGLDPDQALESDIGWGGVSVASLEDMTNALDGIELSAVPLYLRGGSAILTSFAMLVAALKKTGRDPKTLTGAMVADPVGELASQGKLPIPLKRAFAEVAAIIKWSAANSPGFRPIGIGTVRWNDAGATATEELAFGIATAVQSIRSLGEEELAPSAIADKFVLHMGIGSDFFTEICKFRAARLLWANVTDAFGVQGAGGIPIIARTGRWNKSHLDPYVNMLRTTTEAFSAVLGGVEALSVGGFDEVIRPPDEFSRRIARNTQIILGEECSLQQIIDPAGGAWYLEWLTNQLAGKAWEIFQKIEAAGGMAKAVVDGLPQEIAAKSQTSRLEAIAKRKQVMVGVNMYANPGEEFLEPTPVAQVVQHRRKLRAKVGEFRISSEHSAELNVLAKLASVLEANEDAAVETAADAVLHGATLGELTRTLHAQHDGDSAAPFIKTTRAAAPYELIRMATESRRIASGVRPKVFLANMGPLAQHKARADFSRSFFEPGGFDVLSGAGLPMPADAAKAALESGAEIVVICSTDDTYPEIVPALVTPLKEANPKLFIVLAGFPEEHIESFKQAGVDEFIHLRANNLGVLSSIQKALWS